MTKHVNNMKSAKHVKCSISSEWQNKKITTEVLTILANTKNNALEKVLPMQIPIMLLKSTVNTNNNTFVTILFTVFTFSKFIFLWSPTE